MIPIINMTNTKQTVKDAEFSMNLNNPAQQHCAYLHIVEYAPDDKRVMYAGSCQFRQLLEAPDARKNRAWREYVAPLDRVIIRVAAMFDNPHEAFNHASALAREHKPYCNMHGQRDTTCGGVRCIDDGKTFENASQAAKFYGFAAGTMSNHLNKRVGYGTIRGMSFERITGE